MSQAMGMDFDTLRQAMADNQEQPEGPPATRARSNCSSRPRS